MTPRLLMPIAWAIGLALVASPQISHAAAQVAAGGRSSARPPVEVPLAVRKSRDLGRVDPNLRLGRTLLVLRRSPQQEADLQRFLKRLQTPNSSDYHHWLTPTEFGGRFGLDAAHLQALREWLIGHGFSPAAPSAGANVIEFSGTASQLHSAFGTHLHSYRLNSREFIANSDSPSLPAALAQVVAGFRSLNSIPLGGPARPGFLQAFGTPLLAPGDFSTIYDVKALYRVGITGKGETIAVVARSDPPIGAQQQFQQQFLPAWPLNPASIIHNGADPGDVQEDHFEATLDLDWAGAIAPEAAVDFVVSASTATTDGVDLSAQYIVDHDLADVMVLSFGACEADLGGPGSAANLFYQNLDEQAAAQGITVVVSAGDTGSAGCDNSIQKLATQGLGVNALASTPYDTAVGGTEFANNATFTSNSANATDGTSATGYTPEWAWNESHNVSGAISLAAGGGGFSTVYPKPPWQQGPGVPRDGARDLPDLAFVASLAVPYIDCGVCETPLPVGTSHSGGAGTSAAAQAFAGIVALIDQKAGGRQGVINPELYSLAASQTDRSCSADNPDPRCLFHDVVHGNNAVVCADGSPSCSNSLTSSADGSPAFPAAPGFDLATGLGSLDVANLVNAWPTEAGLATQTILQVTPDQLVHGGVANAQIAVTSTGPQPTGSVTLIAMPSGLTVGSGNLSQGAARIAAAGLPGGQISVIARYAGAPGFLASKSQPVSITVSPEPSQTAISFFEQRPDLAWTSGNNVWYGAPLFFQATVLGVSDSTGDGGNVAFADASQPEINTSVALNGAGQSALEPSAILAVGSHTITANYSGDASFQPSVSPTASLHVLPMPTALDAKVELVKINPDGTQTTRVSGTLQSSYPTTFGPHFSGSIAFTDQDGNLLGTVPIQPTDSATLSRFLRGGEELLIVLPQGSNRITTHYSGDQNFLASVSAPAIVDGGSFHFVPPPTPPQIQAGQTAGFPVTLVTNTTPSVATVQLKCGGENMPAAQCTVQPASAPLLAGSTQLLTLSISTGSQAAAVSGLINWPPATSLAFLFAFALGLSCAARRRIWILLPLAIALAACGGSAPQPTPRLATVTPAGIYHVDIFGEAGVDQSSLDFTVVVR